MTSSQSNDLEINKDSGQNEIDDVLSGQWAHYIFEMWKDGVKPITDNKIYINRTLTKSLCESGEITTTIPYKHLVENDLLPEFKS